MNNIATLKKPITVSRCKHSIANASTTTCDICGDPLHAHIGIVLDEKDDLVASYMAILSHGHEGERAVRLFLMLGDHSALEGRKIPLQLQNAGDGEVRPCFLDTNAFPVDEMVPVDELVTSPLYSLIFEIVDFITNENLHIRPHLAVPGQQDSQQSASYMWS